MSFEDQSAFDIRFEWGLPGLQATGSDSAITIVDALCFSTCVSVACARGATVYPCAWDEGMAVQLAEREQARVAVKRGRENAGRGEFSLSPASFLSADSSVRIVLSSPNGSALAYAVQDGSRKILAGCLRNAGAVARWLAAQATPITVIAAGERWADGTIRFAVEDLIGAGAIVSQIDGTRSPEALTAMAAFEQCHSTLAAVLESCSSGRELVERGYAIDVALACELDADDVVPLLTRGAFHATG
jgi:2-phosphosulfolactate phosphatase